MDSSIKLSWIKNLKINHLKISYPEIYIKCNLTKINSLVELKYSYINCNELPAENNFYASIGVNLWKQK